MNRSSKINFLILNTGCSTEQATYFVDNEWDDYYRLKENLINFGEWKECQDREDFERKNREI